MYEDIKAAKTLGMKEQDLTQQVVQGIGRKGYGKLNAGIFTPMSISKNVVQGFQRIADELGIRNPLLDSMNAIANIRSQLFNEGLEDEAGIPNIENPFDTPIIPDLVGAVTNTTQLPPLPNPNLATGTQFGGNVLTGVNEADRFAALFPGDELGKLAANKKQPTRTI